MHLPARQSEVGGDEGLLKRKRASFAGDVLRLATGTGAAQIIGVAAAPLIARMFAPSAFGTLAIFAAVASLISVASTLRYEQAIYLPQDEADAASLACLCFNLIMATSFATALVVWLAGDLLLQWGHVQRLGKFIWLLPLNVAVNGLLNLLTIWNTRERRFVRITVMQVVTRSTMTGAQILIGLAGFVSGGVLIATTILGSVVACAILGGLTLRDHWPLFARAVSWDRMRFVVKRYSTFPRFGLAANILNNASWQLPPLLLSGFFSVEVAGRYSFGFRVLRVPGNLVGANFSRAFFPRAAEANQSGQLADRVELALRYLVLLSFFPCFLLALTGDSLFLLAFGARWSEAGVYAQILSVWLFFWFISTPLNTVFAVLEQQALELRFQIANIVTRFLALVAGGISGSPREAIALFAISGVIVYGSYCLAVMKKSGASVAKIARVMLSCALAFIPAAMAIIGLKLLSAPPLVVVLAAGLILAIYYWNLARTDPVARKALNKFFARLSPAAN